jgi:hypothetical protein
MRLVSRSRQNSCRCRVSASISASLPSEAYSDTSSNKSGNEMIRMKQLCNLEQTKKRRWSSVVVVVATARSRDPKAANFDANALAHLPFVATRLVDGCSLVILILEYPPCHTYHSLGTSNHCLPRVTSERCRRDESRMNYPERTRIITSELKLHIHRIVIHRTLDPSL